MTYWIYSGVIHLKMQHQIIYTIKNNIQPIQSYSILLCYNMIVI